MGLDSLGIISAVVVAIYAPLFIFALRIMLSSKDPSWRWLTLPAYILCEHGFEDTSILFIHCNADRLAGSALLITTAAEPSPVSDFQFWIRRACFMLDVWSSWGLVLCTFNLIRIM